MRPVTGNIVVQVFQTALGASAGSLILGYPVYHFVREALIPEGCGGKLGDPLMYVCFGDAQYEPGVESVLPIFTGYEVLATGSLLPAYVAGIVAALVGLALGQAISEAWKRRHEGRAEPTAPSDTTQEPTA